MRNRLATIAALSLAAVIGTAAAASATPPKGPGGLSPKPTSPPTTQPKGPDKVAPTPTTQPPKGPGDIAQPQPDNDPKPPKGPGDIAQPQPDPVVDPAPPTTPGDDEAGVGEDKPNGGGSNGGHSEGSSQDGTDETSVNVDGDSVETIPVANTEGTASNDESTEAAATSDHDGGMSPFVLLGFAILTAGLIALVVARRRGDEEDAEQF